MRNGAWISVIIAMALFVGCGEAVLGPDPPMTNAEIFDELWTGFDRYYAGFIDRNVDWDAVRARYEDEAEAASTENELFLVLCRMIKELRDPHVQIYRGLGWCDSDTMTYPGSEFSQDVIMASYVKNARIQPSAFVYGTIDDTIGYLRLSAISRIPEDEWREEIESVFDALGGVSRLIIDLRNNGGGNGLNALVFAGFFSDIEFEILQEQARTGPERDDLSEPYAYGVVPSGSQGLVVPTAVLTNRKTGSAAEWGTIALGRLPHVRTFGDTTAGGIGGRVDRQLGNGWSYAITIHRVTTIHGDVYEGHGIPPDDPIMMDSADVKEGRDPVIDAAIRWIRE